MAKSTVRVIGLRKVTRRLTVVDRSLLLMFGKTLDKWGSSTVKKIVPETPRKTGDLQSTVRQVRPAVLAGRKRVFIIIAAGGAVGSATGRIVTWAAEQHEKNPRKPKFVQKVVFAEATFLPSLMKRGLSGLLLR